MSPSPRTNKRRTQTERSDAMRKRLLEATIKCLASDGYAATTVSSIVRRAGVSRGAHVHHYPTKDALILDAAEYLMRRAYRILGDLLLGIADEEDRLQALLDAIWKEIFDTTMFNAFSELLTASLRDKKIAASLRKLSESSWLAMQQPSAHYFEARPSSVGSPIDLFVLTIFALGGIANCRHLVTAEEQVRHFRKLWSQLIVGQIRARKGITAPPPKPLGWHRAESF